MGPKGTRIKAARLSTNESGITLIELLVVVGIIIALAGIAAIGVKYIQRERVSSSTRQLMADIQRARFNAMAQGPSATDPNLSQLRGYGIRFVAPQSYVYFAFNDANLDIQYSGAAEEVYPQTTTLPADVTLSTDNTNAYPVLVYNKFGLPQRYTTGGTQMTAAPAPGMSIVLTNAAAGYTKCVNVTMNTVREGVWNGTTCLEQ